MLREPWASGVAVVSLVSRLLGRQLGGLWIKVADNFNLLLKPRRGGHRRPAGLHSCGGGARRVGPGSAPISDLAEPAELRTVHAVKMTLRGTITDAAPARRGRDAR